MNKEENEGQKCSMKGRWTKMETRPPEDEQREISDERSAEVNESETFKEMVGYSRKLAFNCGTCGVN